MVGLKKQLFYAHVAEVPTMHGDGSTQGRLQLVADGPRWPRSSCGRSTSGTPAMIEPPSARSNVYAAAELAEFASRCDGKIPCPLRDFLTAEQERAFKCPPEGDGDERNPS